jgi:hypothetical protein
MKYLVFLLLIILSSCIEEHKKEQHKQLTPLSRWLVDNEDSLFHSIQQTFNADSLPDQLLNKENFHRDYYITDGILGVLREKIKSYKDCIELYYIRRVQSKGPAILLSPEFDKNCINGVDSIFNDIDSLKYFKIQKYHPPEELFSMFVVKNDSLNPAEIFFKLTPQENVFDLDIFIKKDIPDEAKDLLLSSIFGEEIILKRLRNINYKVTTNIPPGAKTIQEIRERFGIRN